MTKTKPKKFAAAGDRRHFADLCVYVPALPSLDQYLQGL